MDKAKMENIVKNYIESLAIRHSEEQIYVRCVIIPQAQDYVKKQKAKKDDSI